MTEINWEAANPVLHTQLQEMMQSMREMKWKRGKTVYEFAEKWGISDSMAKAISNEASKRVRAELEHKDQMAVKLIDTAERILDAAVLETTSPAWIERPGKDGEPRSFQESPNVARKVALEAIALLTKMVGNDKPQQIEVTGAKGGPLKVTLDDIDAVLAEADANRTATAKPQKSGG